LTIGTSKFVVKPAIRSSSTETNKVRLDVGFYPLGSPKQLNHLCILRLVSNMCSFCYFIKYLMIDIDRGALGKGGALKSIMTSQKNGYNFSVGTRFYFGTLTFVPGSDDELVLQAQEEERDNFRFPLGLKNSHGIDQGLGLSFDKPPRNGYVPRSTPCTPDLCHDHNPLRANITFRP
jgi:hypothetical protein